MCVFILKIRLDWLIGWLVDWLVGWIFVFFGWLAGWLIDWLIDRLIDLLNCNGLTELIIGLWNTGGTRVVGIHWRRKLKVKFMVLLLGSIPNQSSLKAKPGTRSERMKCKWFVENDRMLSWVSRYKCRPLEH